MPITPVHISIGSLFERQFVFRIPKYQRSYAWDESQVQDFIDDIKKCYTARKNNTTLHHFFGGLVCILERIPGSARQQQEVVDGQQRLSTFILLVVNIIRIYTELSALQEVKNNASTCNLVESRITRLKEKYLIYRDEINRVPVIIDRLNMSKADHDFFKSIIGNINTTVLRDSHKKMLNAFNKIGQALRGIIDNLSSVSDKIDALKVFEDIINEDCTVIHIETTTKTEAYMLFQVLNDRGISLTDSDLLRSRTLELLDNTSFQEQQNYIENLWDDILKETPKSTEEFLRYYFASVKGKRPGSTTLFDDFLDQFFPQHKNGTIININDAEAIKTTVSTIKSEHDKYMQIIEGLWPYPLSQPITQWDVERLRLLLVELDHTLCIPLLLAACQLDHRKFAEIIQIIDLFIFRYKFICNNHVGALGELYLSESLNIRNDPENYNVNSLRSKLRVLQESNAQDDKFKLLLSELTYKARGGNKLVKYFLITYEYYLDWYRNGANGKPRCTDKSRIFDFANTTIEHIYPQNADSSIVNQNLESLKNNIANLTILDQNINDSLGNIEYSRKKVVFETSSILMNREIASVYNSWDIRSLNTRKEDMLNAACRIFKI